MWWWPDFAAIDPAWLTLIGVVVAAAIGGTVSVLVARRVSSGSSATADATTIFAASESIRHYLHNENVELRERVAKLEEKDRQSSARIHTLEAQNLQQGHRIEDLEAELARLRGVIDD